MLGREWLIPCFHLSDMSCVLTMKTMYGSTFRHLAKLVINSDNFTSWCYYIVLGKIFSSLSFGRRINFVHPANANRSLYALNKAHRIRLDKA